MKRCPECRRDYYDETLLYCLDDGSALLDGPASGSDSATAILPGARLSSESATRTFEPGSQEITRQIPARSRKVLFAVIAVGCVLIAGLATWGYFYLNRTSEINSIAVMPFVNESGNSEYEYLSDGLTEALINNLSKLPNLSVKARSSVFSYKGRSASPQQVGSELAVQAVLNGRVLQRGDNITLSLELVDASTGNQLWGDQYARKLSDLTVLQSEIARDVSDKLRRRLAGSANASAGKNPTTDGEAYQLYLRGLFHWNKRTADDLKKAIDYFNQAKEKDPAFARAYAGLAVAYSVMPSNTMLKKEEFDEATLRAKAAALRALELDDTLAEPHAVLGVRKIDEWDFAGAEVEYNRAIGLNPNYATAYQWYSELLARLGRHDEALSRIRTAYELDPFSTAVNMNLGLRYMDVGRIDEAEAQFKKTIELSPDYPMAHWFLGDIYFEKGMFEESFAKFEKGNVLLKLETPESAAEKTVQLRNAIKADGKRGYWRQILEYEMEWYRKGNNSPLYVASAYAEIGDADAAFEWLEKAYAERHSDLTYLRTNSRFRSIRNDPRFVDLLRRVGLPTY